MKRLLAVILIMPILVMAIGTGTAFADSPEVTSVQVYSNYQENDDWLIVATYNVTESPYYPYYGSSDYWALQLLDDAGDVVAQTPLQAWGMRPGSIYLSEAQASTLEWGVADYDIRVQALYNASINGSMNISAVDWKGDAPTTLKGWVLGQAAAYGVNDEADATYYLTLDAELGLVLTMEGGSIFVVGIPYIDEYIPEVFSVLIQHLGGWTETDYDDTYSEDLYTWETKFGADIADVMNDAGAEVGLDGRWIIGIIFTIVTLSIMGGSVLLGHSSAGILGGVIIFGIGTLLGIIPLAPVFALAVIFMLLWARGFWLGSGT